MLGAVWLFVLDRKIRHGPEPPGQTVTDQPADLAGAAALRSGRSDGMTGGRGAMAGEKT